MRRAGEGIQLTNNARIKEYRVDRRVREKEE